MGSAGEGFCAWGNSPAQTFSLSGDGITSLTISCNGYNFTGIGAVPLADFVLTTVPEPGTFALSLAALSIGSVLVLQRRKKHA